MTVPLAGVPEMPIRDSPNNALIIYTVLMVVVTSCFLLWWARTAAERKIGPALPLIVVGGVISGLMEAWLDNVVLVGYPPHQALPVIEAFGRSVPIFVPIGYGWFCGGLLYVVARSFQRGITRR
jgi:preprotein translocase subunit SecY